MVSLCHLVGRSVVDAANSDTPRNPFGSLSPQSEEGIVFCKSLSLSEKEGAHKRRDNMDAPTPPSPVVKRRRSNGGTGAPVRFNVGGTYFTTSLHTLRAAPDSFLGRMFAEDSAFDAPVVDETGAVFLDRDPELFGYVLDYLRRGGRFLFYLDSCDSLAKRLADEADFLGLPAMKEQIATNSDNLRMWLAQKQHDTEKDMVEALNDMRGAIEDVGAELKGACADATEQLKEIQENIGFLSFPDFPDFPDTSSELEEIAKSSEKLCKSFDKLGDKLCISFDKLGGKMCDSFDKLGEKMCDSFTEVDVKLCGGGARA